MSPLRSLALYITIALAPAAGLAYADDAYVRIAKAIEAFGEVFREVQVRYVDPVDPVELVDVGINAMLEHLDPYTEYLVGDDSEDLQNMTTGNYVGVGIVVDEVDSALYIADLRQGGSALESKVRIGDRIVRVDTVWADSLDQESLRTHTRGEEGTSVSMWLLRAGRPDTMKVMLQRRALQLESVYAADRLGQSVGYIKLTRFTSTTRDELLEAMRTLERSGPLSALILDLRDNPGGLLEAAIGVAELFVPQGSEIVTTRGRAYEETRLYASMRAPQYPKLPLAVLINANSASASEVVAGAIQDLDRGVIIGERSYGKGFVQSMVPISQGSSILKLTTARYFTPSGRCIQRIDKRGADPSGQKESYVTAAGRAVEARHGIDPDTVVVDSVLPTVLHNLESSGVIGTFATQYAARFASLPQDFEVRKPLVEEFLRYITGLPINKRDPLLQAMNRLQRGLDGLSIQAATRTAITNLQAQIEREYLALVRSHSQMLQRLLDEQIRLRFSTGNVQYLRTLLDIPTVQTAYEVLRSPKYGAFLAPKLPSDQ